jgi:anti-sigma regulatory factor (Ser/Thr protein kinase)
MKAISPSLLGKTPKSVSIRFFLLDAIKDGRLDYLQNAVKLFGITRQAVHRHLSDLVASGYLMAEGSTRARKYTLGPKRWYAANYDISAIDESTAYRRDFSFVFAGLPANIEDICHYGFTEMLNNAIDHSEGTEIYVTASRTEAQISITIRDIGEGIFLRIARLLNLPDPRESLLELSKGKLTTDPKNHTGEGIFFTSRAFDAFYIVSGDLTFSHTDENTLDCLLHNDKARKGTTVIMEISTASNKDLKNIFDAYSSGPDEYRFDRTVVPVRLALYEGERLVSRSQAKRILNRVERFKHVILDFEGVDSIGQAFADEVFRVFKNTHPQIELLHINTNMDVLKMIRRAFSGAANLAE